MRILIFSAAMLIASAAMASEDASFVPAASTNTLMTTAPCLDVAWRNSYNIGVKTDWRCVNRLSGHLSQEKTADIDEVLNNVRMMMFVEENKINTLYKTSK